ncbi:LamG-like jellyroll fold domain-containing protein [Gilvimarinus polysaccharolyticus]|uniref:LamG-like jellyroll fold domain-containing protein n=1 Tax=Gilvimarinus polysaccharolyticus TaxID=863921 RepID=UPI000673A8CA|nr:LamG-like jellyroll fold domain-containing protein [Gilvimarinus polysaccharolyticus]
MNPHDVQLIERYLVGDKNSERELLERIVSDDEFKAELKKQRQMHRLLKYSVYSKSSEDLSSAIINKLQNEKKSVKSNKKRISVLAAACFSLFIFFITNFYWLQTPVSVGSISKLAGVGSSFVLGQSVTAGEFSLDAGYAEITLTNGVVLLLESPAILDFKNVDRLVLSKGALVAKVPPEAIGFAVDTPSANIVDLGTEFGVTVDTAGSSQVHVLDGEVKVKTPQAKEYENLYQNDARSFDLNQQVAVIQSQPNRFMRTLPGRRYQQPQYLHWSFDYFNEEFKCDGSGIKQQCFPAKSRTLEGDTKAPERIKGVFGQAVSFDGISQWLETEFLGIGGNRPRTVAFWVKVPQNFDPHQGFGILSWGLPDKLSAWQISINPLDVSGPLGRIRVGTNEAEIVGTTDLRDNQWHHVAVVLFGGDKADLSTHVLMYIDGSLERSYGKSIARVFTELHHPQSKPLMMGRNIAFSDLDNERKVNRFFRGGVDEVYIFDTALTQQDIHKLMRYNSIAHSVR